MSSLLPYASIQKFILTAMATGFAHYLDSKLLLSLDLEKLPLLKAQFIAKDHARRHILLCDLMEQSADQWPQKSFLESPQTKYTFHQADLFMNQVAHWGFSINLKSGDIVALLMRNRPEYILLWLGLGKIGVVTAFINIRLKKPGLLHSFRVIQPSILIIDTEIADTMLERIDTSFSGPIHTFSPPSSPSDHTSNSLHGMPTTRPNRSIRSGITTSDTALLIFTSGTTGLPKATRVTHFQSLLRGIRFHLFMQVNAFDRIFTCLPLYHTAGGVLTPILAILSGAAIIIFPGFSSDIWTHIRSTKSTILQYIGEMCCYLMDASPSLLDAENQLRAAFGNGLPRRIWSEFQSRYRIPIIYEFYGSTESPIGLLNRCASSLEQGHLGRRGMLDVAFSGTRLLRYDFQQNSLFRHPITGAYQSCHADEIGELVVLLHPSNMCRRFEGYYNDPNASQLKLLHNVFLPGDMYFRTGDLFRVDRKHCWHFIDRIGDTFRWKGENVSTAFVREILTSFSDFREICVYGVEIPCVSGKCCMIAVVLHPHRDTIDIDALSVFVEAHLPDFAIPIFVRHVREIPSTSTFKLQTKGFQTEGIQNHVLFTDPCWYFDRQCRRYIRLLPRNITKVLQSRL